LLIICKAGNPGLILASPSGGVTGLPAPGHGRPHDWLEFTGKVNGLKYDRFGDFEGFFLLTEHGEEKWFESREHEIEALAHEAWAERIRITVFAARHAAHRPVSIVLRDAPRPFES